jgi:aryl sulfotransferase
MSTAAAPPTTRYRSLVFDSARWEGFELRPGDVVVSTPPKCGTTWTQLCCALLVHGGPDLPEPLEQLSPWIDMAIHRVEEVHAALEAQPHRRIIKTHTPLDGVPFHPEVTYVVVGRDPRDVAVSWEHHMANLDMGRLLELRAAAVFDPDDDWFPPIPSVPESPEARYRQFVAADDDGMMNLASVLQHLAVAWERRHLPNVQLVHYADLRSDLPGELLRLAAALDIPLTVERAAELAEEATLDRMRDRAEEVTPSASVGLWRDARRFLRTGGRGEWRALVTPAVEDLYRRRVAALVPADLATWAHAGADL